MSNTILDKTLADLLSSTPPTLRVNLSDADVSGHPVSIELPTTYLWCDNDHCSSLMLHSPESNAPLEFRVQSLVARTFKYICNHCQRDEHHFSILFAPDIRQSARRLVAIKLGQYPPFGPRLPSSVLDLMGSHREAMLSGFRCEKQGMGIGAFAYYRRIVELRKNEILDAVGKVASRFGSPQALAAVERAKNEIQFAKALDDIKDIFPQSLLLEGGHNPLRLLHSALSDGIHAQSDESCLEIAAHIRLLLVEFARRVEEALREQTELEKAVSKLIGRASQQGTASRARPADSGPPLPTDPDSR